MAAYFDVEIGDKAAGRIQMVLFDQIVPKTVENFRALCTGEQKMGFANSVFHRVIPGFMAQGGDFTRGNGTGMRRVFWANFFSHNFSQVASLFMVDSFPTRISSYAMSIEAFYQWPILGQIQMVPNFLFASMQLPGLTESTWSLEW